MALPIKAGFLTRHWGFRFGYHSPDPNPIKNKARKKAGTKLPPLVTWRSNLYFDELDPGWRVIYTVNGHPTIIERPWGRGTIVLCSDSYIFSNEAMRDDRYPELLTWFVGPNTAVVFDETHFGVSENPGIAGLARKYRLHGLLLGLIVLAGLIVWKNSLSLVPPLRDGDGYEDGVSSGRDSAAGLVSLLRRHIAPRDLPRVCFEEWEKNVVRDEKEWGDKLERARRAIEARPKRSLKRKDYSEVYRAVYRILSEERTSWKSTRKY